MAPSLGPVALPSEVSPAMLDIFLSSARRLGLQRMDDMLGDALAAGP